MSEGQQKEIFISFSHRDEAWKDRLTLQMRVLELEGHYSLWVDEHIEAGSDWLPEIEAALNRACVAVMLISADFLTSKFIREKEVPRILERRQTEGLRVIPIILRACSWKQVPWLSTIQVLPKNGAPLAGKSEYEIETELASMAALISRFAGPGGPGGQ